MQFKKFFVEFKRKWLNVCILSTDETNTEKLFIQALLNDFQRS